MLETTPYTFTSWTLTPGAGGNGNHSDGVRPEASPYHGQGYGVGGSGYNGNGLNPLMPVVPVWTRICIFNVLQLVVGVLHGWRGNELRTSSFQILFGHKMMTETLKP